MTGVEMAMITIVDSSRWGAYFPRMILNILLLISVLSKSHGFLDASIFRGDDILMRKLDIANNITSNYSAALISPQVIMAAIIVGGEDNPSPYFRRREEMARRFAARTFKKAGVYVEPWPGVFTHPCPGQEITRRGHHKLGLDRGLTLAHSSIWRHFINRRLAAGSTNDMDALIVFEDDAMDVFPGADQEAYERVQWMAGKDTRYRTDILYLGYCGGSVGGKAPPVCLHAYALSLRGAKRLLQLISDCGDVIDRQVAHYIRAGEIKFDMTEFGTAGAKIQLLKTGEKEGFGFGTGINGFFIQVHYDDPKPSIDEGAVVKDKRGALRYCMFNHTWHRLETPGVNTSTLGCGDIHAAPSVELTDWQINLPAYPIV